MSSWSRSTRPAARSIRKRLRAAVNDKTACLLLQQPNFFGCVEKMETLAKIVHEAGASLVASVDPISLGLLKRPGDAGADIVVAEGQSLGTPMQFGGPYLGILACREQFLRRMPGRLVGQTVDRRGRRCWVLTLQTREQHIRRDKATSNICTNQALLAVRAAIYLATMGPTGLADVANLCLQKAHYAAAAFDGRPAAATGFPAADVQGVCRPRPRRPRRRVCSPRPRRPAFSPACRWGAGIPS